MVVNRIVTVVVTAVVGMVHIIAPVVVTITAVVMTVNRLLIMVVTAAITLFGSISIISTLPGDLLSLKEYPSKQILSRWSC